LGEPKPRKNNQNIGTWKKLKGVYIFHIPDLSLNSCHPPACFKPPFGNLTRTQPLPAQNEALIDSSKYLLYPYLPYLSCFLAKIFRDILDPSPLSPTFILLTNPIFTQILTLTISTAFHLIQPLASHGCIAAVAF
jgi:hypothetical protein